ncbi:MAG: hypothetical protein EON84_02575 [Bradyrhizobiaceae bacterium]|nr:MAG: hypothetical protein EON84_02575 [Bradyrhizobiaceae bacterium]
MKKQSSAAGKKSAAAGLDAGSSGATLRRAHRMHVAKQLIGRVAYDFDEVLHSVLAALDTMHGRIEQNRLEDLGPLVDVACTSLHRAAVLSRYLMAFSRPKGSRARLVNANDVIGSMSVLLRSMLGFEVGPEMHLAPDLPNMICDPVHLETVVFNLALDARNAIYGHGRVVIDTSCTPVHHRAVHRSNRSFIRIGVVDTGRVETGPLMIAGGGDPGQHLANKISESASILMARHFAAAHQGHVDVECHVDEGTCVSLFLPCLSEDRVARDAVGLYAAMGSALPSHHLKHG